MQQINFIDCENLGFQREYLIDDVFKAELGFDDFSMELNLTDTFSLCWEWRYKIVTLYNNSNLVKIYVSENKKDTPIKITDYNELVNFINIVKEKSIHDAINYILNVKNYNSVAKNEIKTTLVSELYEFTKDDCTIYLQKEKGHIRILNEKKKEEFMFRNYKVSKTVSELINYALKSIE